MPIEPKPDQWFEQYEREVYSKFKLIEKNACRPVVTMGLLQCDQPVVRNGRCILHAPKLTPAEKRCLSPDDLANENALEEEFRTALLAIIQGRTAKGVYLNFEGIHFPAIPWNQPPWYDAVSGKQVNFSLCVFHQPIGLAMLSFAKSTFHRTIFREPADFTGCVFHECRFAECVFEGEATFAGSQWVGPAVFSDSRFQGKANFTWSRIQTRLWFKGSEQNWTFNDEAVFHRLELLPGAELIFEHAYLARASFLYSDLEVIRFRSVVWDQAGGESRARLSNRRMLWDERRLWACDVKPELHEAVAQNYRELVIASERRRDYEAAEHFHIGEMEVRRLLCGAKLKNRSLRRVAQNWNGFAAYRVLSAYGTSYWRALLVLIVMVLVISGAFMVGGLTPAEPSRGVESGHGIRYWIRLSGKGAPLSIIARDYSACMIHTLGILTFQRHPAYLPTSRVSHFLQSLTSICLAGQSALVLLSIRRKFRR